MFYFSCNHGLTQKSPHPACAQGQGQGQRARDTDTFAISRKSLLLAGGWLDRHQSSTWWSQRSLHPRCAQGQGRGQRSRDTDTFVISRKSLLLAIKWLDRHQTCSLWSPEEPASTVCARSRSRSQITWHGHFCDFTKIVSSRRRMAGSPPNLQMMVSRRACIQDVLKVKVEVKGHVIGHFCDVTKCLLYSTVSRSVSTCAHFMKHHYTLLPVSVSGSYI